MQRTFTVLDTEETLLNYITDHESTYILSNTKDVADILWLSESFELVLEAPALFEDHLTRIWRSTKENRPVQSR